MVKKHQILRPTIKSPLKRVAQSYCKLKIKEALTQQLQEYYNIRHCRVSILFSCRCSRIRTKSHLL